MSALNGTATVHVHVIYPYIPFEKHERLQLPYEVDKPVAAGNG
jgi:hypothetical protein